MDFTPHILHNLIRDCYISFFIYLKLRVHLVHRINITLGIVIFISMRLNSIRIGVKPMFYTIQ